MLKIRLQRTGRRNDPSFRVVVTEHTRGPKSEKHVDRVGFYNPKTKEQSLDSERIAHWISKGAQASGTVHNMLVKAGIIKGDTINVLPQKSPVKKEEPQVDDVKEGAVDETTGDGAVAEVEGEKAGEPEEEKKEESKTAKESESAPEEEKGPEVGDEEDKKEE